MPITITPLYAALLTLLMIALSVRVVLYRRAKMISVGDSDDKALLKRIRAQGNCVEYAPVGLILLLIAELQGAPGIALHAIGLILLAGRLMHAIGFSRTPQIIPLRVAGMALTYAALLLGALGIMAHGLIRNPSF